MNKAILWDLDGTLLYTLQDLTNATNAALRAFGLPECSLEKVRSIVGNGARCQLLRAIGGEPENFEEIYRYYQRYYPRHCNETTAPYPGIPEAAAVLRARGYRMAIVSNKPDGATKALWSAYFPQFDYAQGETPEVPRKPSAEMPLAALRQLAADPAQSVYVGDSEVDVETARNAGLPCIGALWGYRDRETLERAGAQLVCGTPEELPEAILRLEEVRRGK